MKISGIVRRNAIGGMCTAICLFGWQANAMTIKGEIGFWGLFEGTGGTGNAISDATGVKFLGDAIVFEASDDFLPALGTTVPLTDFQFDPFSPPVSLWTANGITFTMKTVTPNPAPRASLILNGTGVLSGPGFDDTDGIWDFNGSGTGQFSFISTGKAVSDGGTSVPDGGATIFLLGLVLTGLGLTNQNKIRNIEG